MSAVTFNAAPRIARRASKRRSFFKIVSDTLDALVSARVRRAVPEWELRRADREISRCQRLMHAELRTPGGKPARPTR